MVAFVDPEPDEPQDPVEIPKDAIRRANYASWLSLMGFDDVDQRLWSREGEPKRRTVPIITLGGHQYVVTIATVQPQFRPHLVNPIVWEDLWEWKSWPFGPFQEEVGIKFIGLDLIVVKAIGMTLQVQSQANGLMEIEPMDRRDDTGEIDGGAFYGSIFSDGSLLGEVRVSRRKWPKFGQIEVEL